MPSVMWFRRDLRLRDNPALLAAVASAREDGDGRVVPLFVVDPALWLPSGPVRLEYLLASLGALDESLSGALLLQHGDPVEVLPEVVRAAGASSVHVSGDFAPYGTSRDAAVAHALDTVPLIATGSPYAVAPGRIRKPDDTAYRVFTPFYRAWLRHGWRAPLGPPPPDVAWWSPLECDGYPAGPGVGTLRLPPAGEQAAWDRWAAFRDSALGRYGEDRNRADLDGTSAMSHHLRFGEVHPRSLLAELGEDDETYRRELCWREFYADVLHHEPASAGRSLDARFDAEMRWSGGALADEALDAWRRGRTGYPFVDAGMRQLRAEGWVHNRVRMVVASFLVKDLHLPWQDGAREFMHWLRDGDLASNAHGWQWTAGCGTDAAPFYRVFNPVLQGLKFDPDGDYVRRYVPELRHLAGKAVHEPWNAPDGFDHGYPERMVDHATERDAALADFEAIRRPS
ncbi:MAG: deoxyribodipyrimidine photo-lyase [Actinomycetota bacterium]|nr:deoxyribodipyrimidine photo-lyase [Actinomycetota bacterium]